MVRLRGSGSERTGAVPAGLAVRIALGSWVAFALLSLLVATGVLTRWDVALRDLARPHDVWGPAQWRADVIVEGLRPPNLALALTALTLLVCLVRRSLRPAVAAAGVGSLAATASLVVKVLVHRPDPHGAVAVHGGSFPSGHVLTTVVCLGLVLLLARPRPPWWWWLLPGAVGLVMAVANLLEAAHWAGDLLGGGLLGAAVLGTAQALGCGPWLHARSARSPAAAR